MWRVRLDTQPACEPAHASQAYISESTLLHSSKQIPYMILVRCLQGKKREQMDSHVELGWDPLDLTDEEVQIADLLKDCSWVDHSVPAVTHMRGGSQVRSAHD